MMRWLLIILLIAAPLGGFMAWRTYELTIRKGDDIPPIAAPNVPAVDANVAANRLSQAIQFKTIAGPDGAPLDPETFQQFADWMGAAYPALSGAVKREQINQFSLLYTWQGSDPAAAPLLLIGHLDVPAPDPAPGGTNAALFSGAMHDGAVWGRGAQLGKSPLVAMLEAADALAAHGFKPKRTIIFAFGQDGDVSGHAGAGQIAQVLSQRHIKAWFALAEGQPITSKNALTDKPAAMIGVTEKRQLNMIVTAKSNGGAGAVRRNDQAVTSMTQAVVAIDAMPIPASLSDEPTRSMINALAPDIPLSRAFFLANSWAFEPIIEMQFRDNPGAQDVVSTTVSTNVIEGGANQFVRPSEASATINVRLHPHDTPEGFLERARQVVSAFPGVSVDWLEPPGPAIPISSDHSDAYKLVAALASNASDGARTAPSLYIGSTDAGNYTPVATDIYRLTPAIWDADDIANVMGAREHLSRKNLARMITFYEQLMVEAAQ